MINYNIIELIKKSDSSAHARDNLIAKYNFTEPQAKAIVDMKLGRLAGLEKIEVMNEKIDKRSKTVSIVILYLYFYYIWAVKTIY